MTIENYPCDEVKKFGERISSALFNASIIKSLSGLGGCKEFSWDYFDKDLHPYIEQYLKGYHDSVAIMFAAMKTKEIEINNINKTKK